MLENLCMLVNEEEGKPSIPLVLSILSTSWFDILMNLIKGTSNFRQEVCNLSGG